MTAPVVEELLTHKGVDPSLLYPPFAERVRAMLTELRERHEVFWATSGWRSGSEQARLFEQGRTTPGPVVTQAMAYNSPHQFGLALDLVRDIDETAPGIQPSWAPEMYEPLGVIAPRHGLVWGGSWKWPDRPHVQWPGYVSGSDLSPLRGVWAVEHKRGGGTLTCLAACWRFVDAHPTPPPRPE